MVLTAPAGKIPKDVSWNAGKKSMGNVDAFLKSLLNFDKDNVPEKCVDTVEKVCHMLPLHHRAYVPGHLHLIWAVECAKMCVDAGLLLESQLQPRLHSL